MRETSDVGSIAARGLNDPSSLSLDEISAVCASILGQRQRDGWRLFHSTNIRRARYNAETREVTVQFVSGAAWAYEDVPPEVWNGFKDATSAGKWFIDNIKGSYHGAALSPRDVEDLGP